MSKPIGKHTPGPWSYRAAQKGFGDERLDTGIFAEIEGANRIVAECFGRVGQSIYLDSAANAAFIVCAVNNHERLIEALQSFFDLWPVLPDRDEPKATPEVIAAWKLARAALQNAEEDTP